MKSRKFWLSAYLGALSILFSSESYAAKPTEQCEIKGPNIIFGTIPPKTWKSIEQEGIPYVYYKENLLDIDEPARVKTVAWEKARQMKYVF